MTGSADQAAAERALAIILYERKGNVVSADRLRHSVDGLR